jgi:hypothetical protein
MAAGEQRARAGASVSVGTEARMPGAGSPEVGARAAARIATRQSETTMTEGLDLTAAV